MHIVQMENGIRSYNTPCRRQMALDHAIHCQHIYVHNTNKNNAIAKQTVPKFTYTHLHIHINTIVGMIIVLPLVKESPLTIKHDNLSVICQ